MTGHYNNSPHADRPTLCRETSAFLMKAYYQRHMLYGWIVAFSVVLIPTLLISVWPVEDVPAIVSDPVKRDTVSVVFDNRPISVIREHPIEKSKALRPPSSSGDAGLFVNEVILVDDDYDTQEEKTFGSGGSKDEGLFDYGDYDFGDGGGSGVVFVVDTSEYQFNSAEIDCPPFLVGMDQPEYPQFAKRAGIEGTVLLHILVNTDGYVSEVRIEKESNPDFNFGRNAVMAAKSAVFSPAIANHQPVRCWVAIPVKFKIE